MTVQDEKRAEACFVIEEEVLDGDELAAVEAALSQAQSGTAACDSDDLDDVDLDALEAAANKSRAAACPCAVDQAMKKGETASHPLSPLTQEQAERSRRNLELALERKKERAGRDRVHDAWTPRITRHHQLV